MKQTPKMLNNTDKNANSNGIRNVYKSPQLVKYGKISKLTQGNTGPASDGMGGFTMN